MAPNLSSIVPSSVLSRRSFSTFSTCHHCDGTGFKGARVEGSFPKNSLVALKLVAMFIVEGVAMAAGFKTGQDYFRKDDASQLEEVRRQKEQTDKM